MSFWLDCTEIAHLSRLMAICWWTMEISFRLIYQWAVVVQSVLSGIFVLEGKYNIKNQWIKTYRKRYFTNNADRMWHLELIIIDVISESFCVNRWITRYNSSCMTVVKCVCWKILYRSSIQLYFHTFFLHLYWIFFTIPP